MSVEAGWRQVTGTEVIKMAEGCCECRVAKRSRRNEPVSAQKNIELDQSHKTYTKTNSEKDVWSRPNGRQICV